MITKILSLHNRKPTHTAHSLRALHFRKAGSPNIPFILSLQNFPTKKATPGCPPSVAFQCSCYVTIIAECPPLNNGISRKNISWDWGKSEIFGGGKYIDVVVNLIDMKSRPPQKTILLDPCLGCKSRRGMIYYLHEKHAGFLRCGRCDLALHPVTDLDLEIAGNIAGGAEVDQ